MAAEQEISNAPKKTAQNQGNTADDQKVSQSVSPLKFTFNALQLGHVPQELGEVKNNYRFRGYFGARIESARFHIGANGINEFGADYEFGRNVVSAGKNDVPVEFIMASRHEGEGLSEARVSDVAFGMRINLKQNRFFDRGMVDILRHSGIGTSNYTGPEIVTVIGKTMGEIDADLLLSKKKSSPLFAELEVTFNPIAKVNDFAFIKNSTIRPVIRAEGPEKLTLTAALQLTFPSK